MPAAVPPWSVTTDGLERIEHRIHAKDAASAILSALELSPPGSYLCWILRTPEWSDR